MQRQIIVASTPEDSKYRAKVIKWAQLGQLGANAHAVSLDDRRFYNSDGSMNVEQLAWALKQSPLVVILVGDDNSEHPWLDWEGEFCHQWGIKRSIVRIPYSTGWLPEELQLLREIAYNPNAIEKEVRERSSSFNYNNY
jgi:hypothetical protein